MLPEIYSIIFQNLCDNDIKSIRLTCTLFESICKDHIYESLYYDDEYDKIFNPLQSSFVFRKCKKFSFEFSLPESLVDVDILEVRCCQLPQNFIYHPVYEIIRELHIFNENVEHIIDDLLAVTTSLETLVIDVNRIKLNYLPKTLKNLKYHTDIHEILPELPELLVSISLPYTYGLSLKLPNELSSLLYTLIPHRFAVGDSPVENFPKLPDSIKTLHLGDGYDFFNLISLPNSICDLVIPGNLALTIPLNVTTLVIDRPTTKITQLPYNLKNLTIRYYFYELPKLPKSLESLTLYKCNIVQYKLPTKLKYLTICEVCSWVCPNLPNSLLHLNILVGDRIILPVLPVTLTSLKLLSKIKGGLPILPNGLEVLVLSDYDKPLPENPPRSLKKLRLPIELVNKYVIPLCYKNVEEIYIPGIDNINRCRTIHPDIRKRIVTKKCNTFCEIPNFIIEPMHLMME